MKGLELPINIVVVIAVAVLVLVVIAVYFSGQVMQSGTSISNQQALAEGCTTWRLNGCNDLPSEIIIHGYNVTGRAYVTRPHWDTLEDACERTQGSLGIEYNNCRKACACPAVELEPGVVD
jgi:hypothetical protein